MDTAHDTVKLFELVKILQEKIDQRRVAKIESFDKDHSHVAVIVSMSYARLDHSLKDLVDLCVVVNDGRNADLRHGVVMKLTCVTLSHTLLGSVNTFPHANAS